MSSGERSGGERPAGAPGSGTPAPGSGTALRIGARVNAHDGECGELVRVVLEPVGGVLTHVVVAPHHHPGLGKLVPIDLIEAGDADTVRFNGGVEAFHRLDDAEEAHFLGGDVTTFGESSDTLSWPNYGLGMPLGHGRGEAMYDDRIPVGEVEIRRGDPVRASDGDIGSVQGLVVDPADHHVTHVLLREGHFWGHKQVCIPIGATSRIDAEIRVDLTKQQIEDLPPVELRSSS
jgi:hypothetical protein